MLHVSARLDDNLPKSCRLETLIWGRVVAVTTWKSIPQAPNNAQRAAALDYLVLFQKVQLVDEGKQQFLDLHEVKVIAKMPYGSLLGTI